MQAEHDSVCFVMSGKHGDANYIVSPITMIRSVL